MSETKQKYTKVETPGGELWVAVSDAQKASSSGGFEQTGPTEKIKQSFDDVLEVMKKNALKVSSLLKDPSVDAFLPSEVELEFGFSVGYEAGNTFWGLAKADNEASIKITIKWSANK